MIKENSTLPKELEAQMSTLIGGRIDQPVTCFVLRIGPGNTFGRSSAEVIDHYEARLAALFLAMAQNPVALEITNYENLERLTLGIYSHVPVDPKGVWAFD